MFPTFFFNVNWQNLATVQDHKPLPSSGFSLAFWGILGSKFMGRKGHKENWLYHATPAGDRKFNHDRNSLIGEGRDAASAGKGGFTTLGVQCPKFTKSYHSPVLVLRVLPFLSQCPNFNMKDLAVNSMDTLTWASHIWLLTFSTLNDKR